MHAGLGALACNQPHKRTSPHHDRLCLRPPRQFSTSNHDGLTTTSTAKMTSRPVVTIISADGKASEQTHPLPEVFKAPVRPDVVQ